MSAATVLAPTPVGFTHILLATDFSPCSERALPCATAIAKAYQAHLHILHALHPDERARESDYGPGMVDADHWRAQKKLRRLANSRMLAAIPHSQLLKKGRLWEVAERIIRDQGIDLVVVGSRGRGGLGKVLIGSHAEDICRRVSCPVLVVGPRAKAATADFALQRVLFATAYHPGSLHGFAYARSLAERFQAELILFHALCRRVLQRTDRLLAQSREQLNQLASQAVGLQTAAVAQLCDSPAGAILGVAQAQGADLIVLGVHADASATHLPWSTAQKVISEASCPVLTVSGWGGVYVVTNRQDPAATPHDNTVQCLVGDASRGCPCSCDRGRLHHPSAAAQHRGLDAI